MPLSIQHQADSAGDKAVSLIADNSGSNVAAAFKGVNKATQNGDTVADLVVSLDGEAIATGATDDAAAAGAIFPMAGIYQSTVDEVDAGDVGRVRMSVRRAMVITPDWHVATLNNSTVASALNILGSSTGRNSGYGALSTSFFTTLDTTQRYLAIPMIEDGWKSISIGISNNGDQSGTVSIWVWDGGNFTGSSIALYSASLATGTQYFFGNGAAGTGGSASWIDLPALANPVRYILVGWVWGSTPSAGYWRCNVTRTKV